MLVLSRQRNETIMIGDEVEVTVIDIRGDKVRLGINAPRAVTVHRKEVYEAIKRENQAAAQIQPDEVAAASRESRPQQVGSGGGAVPEGQAVRPAVRVVTPGRSSGGRNPKPRPKAPDADGPPAPPAARPDESA